MKTLILSVLAALVSGALAIGMIAIPGDASAWADHAFAYRKQITLDAKAAGVDGQGAAGLKGFPVLIRLDSSQFTFTDVQKNGGDIRFYDGDDRTPLAFQIESFDPALGLAMIWVAAREVPLSGPRPIWMYFGDPKAQPAAGGQVFDAGYRGVYHFAAGRSAEDSSAYRNTVSAVTTAPAAAIGAGAQLDGSGFALPASQSLSINPSDGFTLEVWVREKAAQPAAVVYARRAGAASLVLGVDQGIPYIEVNGQRAAATTPIGLDWAHLAVVGDTTSTTLYVDGKVAARLAAAVPDLTGAATVGADPGGKSAGFIGQMDELRLSALARAPGWLTADYASQKAGATLAALGADEKPSGAGFGYFGIIFKNITPDAWVVIAILVVMAVASWFVMWFKASYIGAVSRGNTAFEARYRSLGTDLAALDRDPEGGRGLGNSSLYRLYQTGIGEVHARGDLKGQALTGETVAAIRASLDGQQVEENQKLDRYMVLLTLAISGGPFIGLLGTVLGVMITFAAIAAAGDVNVNAIAPGIAAALLATVAGLFVAIPALFGYNYLASRNADIGAKMQVFSDQFVTRLAELARNAARQPAE